MNYPESTENGLRQTSKPERLPDFGVLDLLILVSSLGLVFAFQEQLEGSGWFVTSETQWIQLIVRIVIAIQFGIPLTSIYWLVKQKRITGRYFWQPGHWVLFAGSVMAALMMTALPILRMLEDQSGGGVGNGMLTIYLVGGIAAAFIYLVATFSVPGRWRGVFLAHFALDSVYICTLLIFFPAVANNMNSDWVSWLEPLEWVAKAIQLICFVCLLIAMGMDVFQRRRRDWLHWAGILVLVNGVVVTPLLSWVYTRFLSP